jgi:hypothetical protein
MSNKCFINKCLTIILLILFLLLIIFIINKYEKYKNIENFESNPWTTDKDKLAAEKVDLNEVQKKTVTDMINAISSDTLKNLVATQSPLLTGPQGPPGMQGPAGTTLIASGRLVNKNGSYDSTSSLNDNYFNPKYIVSRTEGTSPTSSLSFMSSVSPFASYQHWSLDVNNNITNRYDNTCLTMTPTQDKLYMDKCSNNNNNQKWKWDNSNRIISTTASTDKKLKCIGLTQPINNILTTNVPGCSGDKCLSNTPRRYMVIKDCDINNVNEDEIWSFV